VGEGSASRPGRFLPPGKTRYPLYRRLGGPQGGFGQVRKISPPPGFDPPDCPARSQSLYRLSYPHNDNFGSKERTGYRWNTTCCVFKCHQAEGFTDFQKILEPSPHFFPQKCNVNQIAHNQSSKFWNYVTLCFLIIWTDTRFYVRERIAVVLLKILGTTVWNLVTRPTLCLGFVQ
jgi:hypothetical protein